MAGTYRVVESQPASWLDGQDTPGTVDGVDAGVASANDRITNIDLLWGSTGIEYNFGELLPGSIEGVVHADLNRNCVFEPFESPIANVKIELLNAQGRVLATTYTNAQGALSIRRTWRRAPTPSGKRSRRAIFRAARRLDRTAATTPYRI